MASLTFMAMPRSFKGFSRCVLFAALIGQGYHEDADDYLCDCVRLISASNWLGHIHLAQDGDRQDWIVHHVYGNHGYKD